MRAAATGDAGPQLNPSGISLTRAFVLEGSYQYGSALGSNDARISAVDSTSALNLGGALYYAYHRGNAPTPGGATETAQLAGASLSFPLFEKLYLGGNAKYIDVADPSSMTHKGFTFDAGLTIRPISILSIAAVGYNLRELGTAFAPRAAAGGIALLPMPTLLFVFDGVLEKIYDDPTRDQSSSLMGGGEFSFSDTAAVRAGGGHDGLTRNGYISAGLTLMSASAGAFDLGIRQDISGNKKSTFFGIGARIFVPSP
jgi:hypothetical protein